jgi:hypothetical protein
VGYRRTSRSPGFSRWDTCRGRTNFRESRLQPVEYLPGRSLLPGKPDPATAGTPVGRRSGVPAAPIMFWSPGFSRWNTCRGRSLLPGKPGPAKAGTPVGRRSGVPASAGGIPKNIRESRRQPVEYLPGRGILPGKPGPAKAGTPVGRRSGVPAAPIMFWSPGFSRWNTCGGAAYCPASLVRLKPGLQSDGGRASRLRPLCSGVPASAGGIPAGGAAVSGRPGVSRWDTCRGAAYCPASPIRLKPGLQSDGGRASRLRPLCSGVPALAGEYLPGAQQFPGVPASAGGIPKNIPESRL